jgi:excisionase family DNA binding protein
MTDQQKGLATEMIKCNMYLVRYLEINTSLKFTNYGKIEDIMTMKKQNITHRDAANNILEMANKLCKNELLLNRIKEMRKDVLLSDIADVKLISHWNPKAENELESELADVETKTLLQLNIGMLSVTEASELTGIKNNTIKQACQQGRLFNIKKVGKGWQVNIDEVKEYWDVKEERSLNDEDK